MRPAKIVALGGALVLVIIATWGVVNLQPGSMSGKRGPQSQSAVLGGPAAISTGAALSMLPGSVQASPINLSLIPRLDANPDNLYDRWLRGEVDLDESESVVDEAEREALVAAAMALEPDESLSLHSNQITVSGPFLELGFEGLDIADCCGSGAAVPPDPELAVGPNHVLVAVNVALEIYDKSGATLISPTTFAALFGGVNGCTIGTPLFDPNVLYDEEADRYFLGIDGGGASYCLAVSQSGDPTQVWYRYRFPLASSNEFFDYPQAGVGRDAVYLGGNVFDCGGCPFKESRVWAFDKWAMYAGAPTNWKVRALSRSEDTPQPANLHGAAQGTWPLGGPHYILTETNFNGATYSVFAWDQPFGANSLYRTGVFDLVAATGVNVGYPVSAPQPGGGMLKANDWRLQDAEYRNGFIWTTNTVACNPGGGTVDCIRWAQVNPTNAAVMQAGVLASQAQYRFYGDLAVNHCNDMAVGYTKAVPGNATAGYPSIWVAGRSGHDPPNSLAPESQLRGSSTPYTAFDGSPFRWGDYTGFTSDPNGLDLWYVGQYSKSTGSTHGRWGTYVGRFSFPDPPTAPSPPPVPGLTPRLYLPLLRSTTSC